MSTGRSRRSRTAATGTAAAARTAPVRPTSASPRPPSPGHDDDDGLLRADRPDADAGGVPHAIEALDALLDADRRERAVGQS